MVHVHVLFIPYYCQDRRIIFIISVLLQIASLEIQYSDTLGVNKYVAECPTRELLEHRAVVDLSYNPTRHQEGHLHSARRGRQRIERPSLHHRVHSAK